MQLSRDDLCMQMRNLKDSVVGTVWSTFGVTPTLTPLKFGPIGEVKTIEDLERRRADMYREYARLVVKDITVLRPSDNQLQIIGSSKSGDASISMCLFCQYLVAACRGSYGYNRESFQIEPKQPVVIVTDPTFDRALGVTFGARSADESIADIGLRRGLHRREDLNSATALELVEGLVPLEPGAAAVSATDFADRMVAAAVKLSPGFEMIPFAELEENINRKAELEIAYPTIDVMITEHPGNIDYLTRRIAIDLNTRIKSSL